MRLIDADELMEEVIRHIYDTYSPEARRAAHNTQALYQEIIQKQPTAYDVDKVVEQINEEISKTPEYKHKFCESVKEEHCSQYESCEDCMAEMMIEIVKSGGIAKR